LAACDVKPKRLIVAAEPPESGQVRTELYCRIRPGKVCILRVPSAQHRSELLCVRRGMRTSRAGVLYRGRRCGRGSGARAWSETTRKSSCSCSGVRCPVDAAGRASAYVLARVFVRVSLCGLWCLVCDCVCPRVRVRSCVHACSGAHLTSVCSYAGNRAKSRKRRIAAENEAGGENPRGRESGGLR
jgi:hypothetical protein